ncbi:hypothetical protein ASE99_21410 [Serratia sp. Leaf51]|nr:hypothetical protein ASE99_21410 [Serratia sp. Leaf51]
MCRKETIFQTFLLGEIQSGAQSKRLAACFAGFLQYPFEIHYFLKLKMTMTQQSRIIMTNTAARWEND